MKTIDGCKSERLRMGKLSLGAAILVGLAGCGSDTNTDTNIGAIDPQQPVEDWVMVWSDEFDGASIDSNKWTHEVDCNGGGNQEQQCYTDSAENSFVADGMLNIVAKTAPEGSAKPYTSARLNTKEHMDWKYGRFEMRAKLPSGQGSWPAFWMLPTDEVYGGWPRSGEIDIIESVNLKAGTTEGGSEAHVYGTLHYGKVWPDNSSSGQPYLLPDEINPADDFHTYAIEWQEGEIRWYVDDYLYATQRSSELRYNAEGEAIGLSHRGWFSENFNIVTGELETQWSSAPYDEKFHLILNFAVGGNWPSSVNDTGIDAEVFADGQTFAIDYVRVYECASNPDTGKGCETVRPGYDSLDDALVEGKAPNPPLPTPPTATANLTVFTDAENPSWPMWDCCGGSTPTVETDDADHGATAEFTIGAQPTVMGFITRESSGGDNSPYNASGIKDDGVISFDMKVTSAPADGTATWRFKVESAGGQDAGGTAVELALTDSNEGAAPVTGQWQTYTFSLQTLFDAGLDLSAIDVLMIFPDWGKGEGAVYRLDNVMIGTADGGTNSPELTIFENNYNPDWPMWDCCGGSTPTEESDDAEHGITAEFSIGETPTVMGFITRSANGGSDTPFNGSSILASGVVAFDVKLMTAPSDASATWRFKLESSGGPDNGGTAVELDLASGSAGMAPTVGEWRSYSFTLQSLFDAGLDVSAIDVLMIFPDWGKGNGAVYRVDNVKIHDPNGTSNPAPSSELKLYQDTTATDWVLWDCCGGSTPTQETDDEDHGSTAEFSIGSTPTVMGIITRSANGGGDAPFDSSALLATGVIKFDMKVVTAPSDGSATWRLKLESAGGPDNGGTAVEVGLADSNEGVSPATGTWQTYMFTLQSLFDAGLDISAIDVVMIFPDWGKGEGAVYRIDNAVIGAP
ncbi:family 16 glycosylhydrolase [Shewanella woodyi]|uniref:family 16 glycosylhydrolase n=1 Tax=Shewanella woodyi TaxID=60961 RepID=UPI003749ED0F